MPVFDQAAFVPRAIGSLLAQDVEDWELVVVDDGSPAPLANPLPDDPRVISLRHERNRGLGTALNTGLDQALAGRVAAVYDRALGLTADLEPAA